MTAPGGVLCPCPPVDPQKLCVAIPGHPDPKEPTRSRPARAHPQQPRLWFPGAPFPSLKHGGWNSKCVRLSVLWEPAGGAGPLCPRWLPGCLCAARPAAGGFQPALRPVTPRPATRKAAPMAGPGEDLLGAACHCPAGSLCDPPKLCLQPTPCLGSPFLSDGPTQGAHSPEVHKPFSLCLLPVPLPLANPPL